MSNAPVIMVLLGLAAAIGGFVFYSLVVRPRQLQAMKTSIVGEGAATPGTGNTAEENFIGPPVVINGVRQNRSVGCPATLLPLEGAIGYVDIPQSTVKGLSGQANPIDGQPTYEEPDGHIHYVTANMAPPPDAKGMECVFRAEADPTAELRPRTGPDSPSSVSLFMQRKGEDLSGVGEKVYFRWWTLETYLWEKGRGWLIPLGTDFTITAPFDIDHWLEEDSEMRAPDGTGLPNPPERRKQMLAEMLANCQLMGFTCGGADGKGHGFYAVGKVRLVLVSRRFI